MYKKIAGVVTALALFSFALVPAAQASSLTSGQIQAILSLLSAFGANASVVSNVELALTGQPFTVASSSTSSTSSATSTSAACVNLTYNLYRGESDASAGGEISALQRFLHVLPVSGFFGPLTEQAVQRYQAENGIVSTGTPATTGYGLVGPHTRGWMQCGHAVPPTWPPSHATSTNPSGSNGNPGQTNASNITLTASSTGSLTENFTVTGLSSGAAYTLNFGDGKSAALQGDASGTSTVAHAYVNAGWYEVELLNAEHKTLDTTFVQVQKYEPGEAPLTASCAGTVDDNGSALGVLWQASASGGDGSYFYQWLPFDDEMNVSSNKLASSSFSAEYYTSGAKEERVTVRDGAQSVDAQCEASISSAPGTSTSTPSSTDTTSSPVIETMTPLSGGVGTQVTLTGDNFTPTGNVVHFGAGAIGNLASSPLIYNCPMMTAGSTQSCGQGGEKITFTVPSALGPYCPPGTACPMYRVLVTPNTYAVYVQNSNGTSNKESFTVTGANALGE